MRREGGVVGFINRSACSVFCLRIPNVHGRKLRKAVAYKLVTVFPGNIDEFDLDIRRNGDRGDYLVFVIPKELSRDASYSSTLVVRNRVRSGTVLFLYDSWIEVIVIESGAIEESYVRQAAPETIIDQVNELRVERCDSLRIFCRRELAFRLVSDASLDTERIVGLDDLRLSIRNDAHFPSRNSFFRQRRVLECTLAFFFLIVTICVIGLIQRDRRQVALAAQRRQSASEKAIAERRALEAERDELEASLARLVEERIVSPFSAMAAVSGCLDGKTRIASATFKNNYFQFEFLSGNPLEILSRLESDVAFKNVSMRNLASANNMERASISGSVAFREKQSERDNDIVREIERLRGLIEREKRRNEYPAYRSKSAYAMAAKGVLEKNGCKIASFRFTETSQGDCIEYSFVATPISAVQFFKDASAGSNRFEISQIQIRNPDAGRAMEVTVLMRLSISDRDLSAVCVRGNESDGAEHTTDIAKNYSAPVSVRASEMHVPATHTARTAESAPGERVLEYVGTIAGADGNRYVFAKDVNGRLARFILDGAGDMSCRFLAAGRYAASMNGNSCDIGGGE